MKRILTSTDLISAVSCLWQCLPAHHSPDWCLNPELLSPVDGGVDCSSVHCNVLLPDFIFCRIMKR